MVGFSRTFRSNFDLSAARAASVADFLVGETSIQNGRLTISGLADSKPIGDNSTARGRAKIEELRSTSMSNIRLSETKQSARRAPPWMSTFADLATLLMAFFVCLYLKHGLPILTSGGTRYVLRQSIGFITSQGGSKCSGRQDYCTKF